MSAPFPAAGEKVFLARAALEALMALLREKEYLVVAPALREGVVVLAIAESPGQLPLGLRDEQSPGHYRTMSGEGELYFQLAVGPDSPKRYVFPARMTLFSMRVEKEGFVYQAGRDRPPKLALVGIRPCDLAAIGVLDRVLLAENRCESDGYYRQIRQGMVVVVANCTRPGGNCFCGSMGTGPAAREGFDLALTELRGGFVAEVGSAKGSELARALGARKPTSAELELAELLIVRAREHMGRTLPALEARQKLAASIEHPHWDDVAQRCLGCGNCTMVCPTCFCSSVVDSTELVGGGSTRTRVWDSCFTHQFSYTTAGPHRTSLRARYRHWIRHKLCTFWDQFGCGGCVGCGRCITWCPAGIDLTREAAAVIGEAAPRAASREGEP